MIINLLAGIGQAIWIISALPQIYKTFKSKNVKDVSLVTWLLFLLGYITVIPILYVNQIWIMVWGYIISLFLILIEIILILRYRKWT